MGKYAAMLVALLLVAAAFFLPVRLSRWQDEQLLDDPHVTSYDKEREGFAESTQLSAAEKLLLLRSGTLTQVDLGGETVLKKLRMTDVDLLTPIEALNLLAELKQDLNGG